MKKLAIIVVGKHYAGKTRTLWQVKSLLKMRNRGFKFTLGKCTGWILTQTLQEPDPPRDLESLNRYQGCDVLILPSRPKGESSPTLQQIKKKLRELGFKISEVNIERRKTETYRKTKAREIIRIVKGQCK